MVRGYSDLVLANQIGRFGNSGRLDQRACCVHDRAAINERLWLATTNFWTPLSVLGPTDFVGRRKSHVYRNDAHGVLTRDSAALLFRLLGGDEPQIRRALDPPAGLPARQIYVRVQHLRGYDNQHEAGR